MLQVMSLPLYHYVTEFFCVALKMNNKYVCAAYSTKWGGESLFVLWCHLIMDLTSLSFLTFAHLTLFLELEFCNENFSRIHFFVVSLTATADIILEDFFEYFLLVWFIFDNGSMFISWMWDQCICDLKNFDRYWSQK